MAQHDEFGGAKVTRFLFLCGAGAEDDSLRAEFGRELDRQVAEAADTQDADSETRAVIFLQSRVDGGASTLKRSSVRRGDCIGNRIDIRLGRCVVGTEGAVGEIAEAVAVAL